MQRNNNSIMIFEIIRGGGKLTGWGKNGPAYFFPGERIGQPILSPGKKLTGEKFWPVTPGNDRDIFCRPCHGTEREDKAETTSV